MPPLDPHERAARGSLGPHHLGGAAAAVRELLEGGDAADRADAPWAERGDVVRAGGRRSLGTAEEGLVEDLLSPDLGGSFEIVNKVIHNVTVPTVMPSLSAEATRNLALYRLTVEPFFSDFLFFSGFYSTHLAV